MFVVSKFNNASAWGGVAYGTGNNNQAFGIAVKSGTGELVLQGWGGGNDLVSSASAFGAGWSTHCALLASGTATLFKDGLQLAQWTHTYNSVLSRLIVGREIANLGYVGMDVAAVFIYNRALNASERASVEAYLRDKFLSTSAPPDNTPPTSPGALSATAAGSSLVKLSWTAATDNVAVVHYKLERCTGSGCSDFAPLTTAAGLTFDDASVLPSTLYRYRIRAADAAGNLSGYSPAVSVTTPASTGGLILSGLVLWLETDTGVTTSGSTVTAWADQSTLGNSLLGSGNAQIGVVQTPSGLPAIRLDGSSGKLQRTTTMAGFPAANGDRSLFVVARYNSSTAWAGVSYGAGSANQAFGVTVKHPTGELVLQGWGGGNDLVSTAPGIGSGWMTQGAVVQSGTGTLFKNGQQIAQWSHTYNTTLLRFVVGQEIANFGFVGMDVACILLYNRALSATERQNVQAYLESKYLNGAPTDTIPPTAPSNLASAAATATQVNLNWSASSDNVAVTEYKVERCVGGGCLDFTPLAAVAVPQLADTAVNPSTTYRYRVRASDAAGNASAFSSIVSVTTASAIDTTPPASPATLNASASSSNLVLVSWSAAVDNVGVTAYLLERCAGAGCGNFVQIASSGGLSYADNSVIPSTTYRYRVRAVDAAINSSPYSAIATATTPAPNKSPTLVITTPADNSVFTRGTKIQFSATATDQEDGNLSSAIIWRSNRDGVLGTGASLLLNLSAGTHIISGTVTDTAQSTVSRSITVVVQKK